MISLSYDNQKTIQQRRRHSITGFEIPSCNIKTKEQDSTMTYAINKGISGKTTRRSSINGIVHKNEELIISTSQSSSCNNSDEHKNDGILCTNNYDNNNNRRRLSMISNVAHAFEDEMDFSVQDNNATTTTTTRRLSMISTIYLETTSTTAASVCEDNHTIATNNDENCSIQFIDSLHDRFHQAKQQGQQQEHQEQQASQLLDHNTRRSSITFNFDGTNSSVGDCISTSTEIEAIQAAQLLLGGDESKASLVYEPWSSQSIASQNNSIVFATTNNRRGSLTLPINNNSRSSNLIVGRRSSLSPSHLVEGPKLPPNNDLCRRGSMSPPAVLSIHQARRLSMLSCAIMDSSFCGGSCNSGGSRRSSNDYNYDAYKDNERYVSLVRANDDLQDQLERLKATTEMDINYEKAKVKELENESQSHLKNLMEVKTQFANLQGKVDQQELALKQGQQQIDEQQQIINNLQKLLAEKEKIIEDQKVYQKQQDQVISDLQDKLIIEQKMKKKKNHGSRDQQEQQQHEGQQQQEEQFQQHQKKHTTTANNNNNLRKYMKRQPSQQSTCSVGDDTAMTQFTSSTTMTTTATIADDDDLSTAAASVRSIFSRSNTTSGTTTEPTVPESSSITSKSFVGDTGSEEEQQPIDDEVGAKSKSNNVFTGFFKSLSNSNHSIDSSRDDTGGDNDNKIQSRSWRGDDRIVKDDNSTTLSSIRKSFSAHDRNIHTNNKNNFFW